MSDDALEMRGPVRGTKDARRVAIGSGVGAVIETYDFIGFGTAAALYFGHAFFPGASPVAGTLAAFATLGVGFAARPLGGIIGGHLGDKLGRKPVLVASLILMGVATFAIGLLPTYESVGIVAPILLVTVRIIQGLAFGGGFEASQVDELHLAQRAGAALGLDPHGRAGKIAKEFWREVRKDGVAAVERDPPAGVQKAGGRGQRSVALPCLQEALSKMARSGDEVEVAVDGVV